MSKSDSVTHKIALLTSPNYRILNRNVQNIGIRITVMIPISKEEEALIDNIDKEILNFERGDRTFKVQMKDIYCYGEVDFNDKNTLDKIEEFTFLDYLGGGGIHIEANYDYATNSCTSPNKGVLWTETWSPSEVAKRAHGYLGKPQRILLFNQTLKK